MQDTDSNASTDSRGRRGEERAWAAHMAGLRASYHRHLAQHPDRRDSRIEALLDPQVVDQPANWRNWEIPNEIEILLVQMKLGADLEVALDSAFLTAEKIAVPTFAVLAKRRDAQANDEAKQALLAKLLRDTHNRYAARRSERAERARVAKRMTYLGFGLTGVIIGVFLILGTGWFAVAVEKMPFTDLVKYNLIVTTFFGFLGAYLSRLIAFQNTAVSLSVDDLENGYSWHFLMVRLLVGGLSSVILYFVISGHLIGGELFPAPANGATGGFGDLWTKHDGPGMPYEGPSANFAKLIVWCFIAGFSERFLPDSLSALEAKSRS
ncbi:hypothetical protein [Rhodobacter sp. SY28-1]|uniref:hypothetical protein n=1 Tax=Rhodobacter sp. SY28-1 TaxID=2562317 RepID=UPI0010BF6E1C|nr:hypothetical protein [Rhodobacter sp. SY28-1]